MSSRGKFNPSLSPSVLNERGRVLYLLDANVLIDANRDYYPIDRVPQFWDWLVEMGERGRVKVPQEIYDEIVFPRPNGPDALVDWLTNHRGPLLLGEQAAVDLVAHVTEQGYADDLADDEIEKIGRDPFLIAYALADVQRRRVVTNERSRSNRTRANRHIPDVCRDLGVISCHTFTLIRDLDFRTGRNAN